MKIKNIWKLIKITTFLKSIFNIIYVTKFFDVQTRFHSCFFFSNRGYKIISQYSQEKTCALLNSV